MDLQNRENFLNKLAAKMGKQRANVPESMATPVNTYPTERLTHLTQAELCEEFVNFAKVKNSASPRRFKKNTLAIFGHRNRRKPTLPNRNKPILGLFMPNTV